jgi:two-component system response regulator FixJ
MPAQLQQATQNNTQANMVAVVDDDPAVRASLQFALEVEGFDVRIYASARAMLNAGHFADYRCLIVDQNMPAMTGLELQRHLGGTQCRIPMIFITALDDPLARAQALEAGALDFLKKPFDEESLLDAVHAALGYAQGRETFP